MDEDYRVPPPDEQLEALILGDRVVQENVVVHNCLSMWWNGHCTLNQALLYAIHQLARQNKGLLDMCVKMSQIQPMTPFYERGDKHGT